jgi:hypothetical protein
VVFSLSFPIALNPSQRELPFMTDQEKAAQQSRDKTQEQIAKSVAQVVDELKQLNRTVLALASALIKKEAPKP